MIRYQLVIAVEVKPDGWDCGCDETADIMRIARSLRQHPLVRSAFLVDYEEISKDKFEQLYDRSFDVQGI